ncbi:MAG: TonB-dependent siderophore receptor [Lautropia sp.]|nr:TonB-dependent siderophore receptor [Lautropia sp.]
MKSSSLKHRPALRATGMSFSLCGFPSLMVALGALAPAVLPLSAQAQTTAAEAELAPIRVTADFDPDDVRPEGVTTATKTYLAPRDIPQTIDTVEVSKSKSYGINDLSVMLDGTPGVSTAYDMRGEGVYIRGFQADNNDLYRDGIRESGQVRRSTANVERIEVLKGPASVLYGRSSGGGVINMVSKQARFDAGSSVSLRGGSWRNVGGTLDMNKVLNRHVAVRLVADREQAHSFRSGIRNRNEMFSPSILVDTRTGLRWLGQYTWDTVWRVPDRGPVRSELPEGVSIRTGFARPGDYVEDKLRVLRSDLGYDFNKDWKLRWVASQRKAHQNFDYVFLGTWCNADGRTNAGATCTWNNRMRQRYAWQVTENETTTNTLDLTGMVKTAGIQHDLLVGLEYSEEERHPLIGTIPRGGMYRDAIDPYNPVWPTPYPDRPTANTHNLHEGKTKALYVQDLISFNEQWKLLAGLRYDQFSFHSTNLLNGAARGYKDNALSQRLGAIWQPTKTQSIYASWSKSFSPYGGRGMINVATTSSAVYDADPQYSRQVEVGIKSDWAEGAFSTQASIYQLEHYNIRYQPDENDPYLWAVRGRDRSRGVEFSISGRLLDDWYVRGGVSFANAEIESHAEEPEMVGKLLPNFAKRNGNLFVRYAPAGNWYGEVGVTHTGPRWEDEDNTQRLPSYTRWDAMAGWRQAPWTVTLAVTNLLDKEYWRSSAMPGAPRTFLLTANYQF